MTNQDDPTLTPTNQRLIDSFNLDQLEEAYSQGVELDQEQITLFQELANRLKLPCPVKPAHSAAENNTIQLVQRAILKALELHAGQTRKDGVTPYIVHPLAVGFTVARFTDRQDIIAAAILHDTIEDTDYTLAELRVEFGDYTAYLVDLLSEDKSITDWATRKEAAIEKVSKDAVALVLKSADSLANMRDLRATVLHDGVGVWQKFNTTKEAKLAHFQQIFDLAEPNLPGELLEDCLAAMKDLKDVILTP